jgi:hypothetical protein
MGTPARAAGRQTTVQSTKPEFRSTKQISRPRPASTKRPARLRVCRISAFPRFVLVSCFGIRISCFYCPPVPSLTPIRPRAQSHRADAAARGRRASGRKGNEAGDRPRTTSRSCTKPASPPTRTPCVVHNSQSKNGMRSHARWRLRELDAAFEHGVLLN